MTRPCGAFTPEDCAGMHWAQVLNGSREGSGWRWRAPCPADRTPRTLEWSVKGKSIYWNSFCPSHDKEALKPLLSNLLGVCFPSRARGPQTFSADDLAELALSGMTSALSIKLALLEMSGLSTRAALDKLGVSRQNRPRVINGRQRLGSETKAQVGSVSNPRQTRVSNPRQNRR